MKKQVILVFTLVCFSLSFNLAYAQEPAETQGQDDIQAQPDTKEQVNTKAQVKNHEKPKAQEKARQSEDETQGKEPEKIELINRIEELEKRINELTEESRARRKLEITEQEKQEKEKEVLEAVSRDYSLSPKYTLGLDYSLSYQYSPSERYKGSNAVLTDIDRDIDHTIRHTISTSYSVMDNFAVNTSFPVVYRYDKMGSDNQLEETDIGDITAGVTVEPIKSGIGDVRTILNLDFIMPTGRSPYEINQDKELSTGSGLYAASLTGSFSKQVDPVVAFWNVGYTYRMDATGLDHKISDTVILEKVKSGDSFSFSAGLGYALSYKVSVNSSFSYSYSKSSSLYYRNSTTVYKTGDNASGSFGVGMGWKVSNQTTLSFSLSYELTGSGFSFTFRAPFTFIL